MESADAEQAGGVFDEGDGGASPAAAAMGRSNKEFINKSVAAAIFEAVAEGADNV